MFQPKLLKVWSATKTKGFMLKSSSYDELVGKGEYGQVQKSVTFRQKKSCSVLIKN